MKNRVILAALLSFMMVATCSCKQGFDLKIMTPYDGAVVYASPLPIFGIVNDLSANVIINEIPVVLSEKGTFNTGVDLRPGNNLIYIVATNEKLENIIVLLNIKYVVER